MTCVPQQCRQMWWTWIPRGSIWPTWWPCRLVQTQTCLPQLRCLRHQVQYVKFYLVIVYLFNQSIYLFCARLSFWAQSWSYLVWLSQCSYNCWITDFPHLAIHKRVNTVIFSDLENMYNVYYMWLFITQNCYFISAFCACKYLWKLKSCK